MQNRPYKEEGAKQKEQGGGGGGGGEGRAMMQAVLMGEAGLNYASVPHQSPRRPVAPLSSLVTDWELYDALVFVHRITLTD